MSFLSKLFRKNGDLSLRPFEQIRGDIDFKYSSPVFTGVPDYNESCQSTEAFLGVPSVKSIPFSLVRLTKDGKFMSNEFDDIFNEKKHHGSDHIRIKETNYPLVENPLRSSNCGIWSFKEPLLEEARNKPNSQARTTGIGSLDLAEITFEAKHLDKKAIRALVEKIQSGESISHLISEKGRDNQPVIIWSQDSLDEVHRYISPRAHCFENLTQALHALAKDQNLCRDLFHPKNFWKISGIDELSIKLRDLPAEILLQLKPFKGLVASSDICPDEEAFQKRNLDHARQLPMSQDFGRGRRIRSQFLDMTVYNSQFTNEITNGAFERYGSMSNLTAAELMEFYKECSKDKNSRVLCETYFRAINLGDFRERSWTKPSFEQAMHPGSPIKPPCDPVVGTSYARSSTSPEFGIPPELRGASAGQMLDHHKNLLKREQLLNRSSGPA